MGAGIRVSRGPCTYEPVTKLGEETRSLLWLVRMSEAVGLVRIPRAKVAFLMVPVFESSRFQALPQAFPAQHICHAF
jgi:hypothetical protein